MGTKGKVSPQLPKPSKVNLELFAESLERTGYYPIESNLRATLYVTHGDEIGIITHSKGYMRARIDDIPKICEELMGIYQDDKDRQRMGVKN